MKKERPPRALDAHERALWQRVTEAVAPLRGPPPSDTSAGPSKADSGAAHLPPAPKQPAKRAAVPKRAPALKHVSAPHPPPAAPVQWRAPHDPGTLDGGLQRKLRRGRIAPDAKLDLHGLSQAEALLHLRVHIPRLRAGGARCLLVVTGKGSATALARHTLHGSTLSHTPERRGVLRDKVPDWLAEVEFRPHVAAVRPAHPRHGGGGAIYVWLRRPR